MTMLAVGRGLRDLANKGMSAVSRAEAMENQQQLALETAEQQQRSATLGTGAGVGGMVGANKLADLNSAANAGIESINTALDGAGTASRTFTGGLEYTPVGEGATTLTGDAAVTGMKEAAMGIDAAALQSAPVEGVLANAAPVVEGTAAVAETAAVGGEAVAAVEAGTAAAQGGGAMAQLASLATPIAIGLGVAFLLNKLFD